MTTNVGTNDRILRASLGLALFYLAFLSGPFAFDGDLMKYNSAVGSIMMLVVAAIHLWPTYTIFGFKTCQV